MNKEYDFDRQFLQKLLDNLRRPACELHKLDFADPNPESFAEFVAQLPSTNPAETGNQLYKAVQQVAALQIDPIHKQALLEILCNPIISCSGKLANRTLNQESVKAVSVAQALLKYLVGGYKATLCDLIENRADQIGSTALIRLILRAMELLGILYLRAQQLYLPSPGNLWLELHSLYRIARHLQIHDISTRLSEPEFVHPDNILNNYLRILLFGCADPKRWSPAEMESLHHALKEWANHAELAAATDRGLYLVDIESERPPFYATRTKGITRTMLRIRTDKLVSYLRERMENRTRADAIDGVPKRLVLKLCDQWTVETERRDKRLKMLGNSEVILGLSDIHAKLSSLSGFQTVLVGTEQQMRSLPNHDGGREWSIHAANELNISKQGTCIKLNSKTALESRPGELIAVHRGKADNWKVGIVRWKRTLSDLSAKVGIEFFARPVEPCLFRIADEGDSIATLKPALVIGDEPGRLHNCEIVLPDTKYRRGDRLEIITLNGAQKAYLGKDSEFATSVAQFKLLPD